ncbi:hypothetical protein VTN77DRAFT_2586 [Rasamsonia byssochlamydoides]|uniref:uncharacterized protein n=1 Tax=Rasamsonia byssochlamydoides TaxID=89139 RepID=UPI0037448901
MCFFYRSHRYIIEDSPDKTPSKVSTKAKAKMKKKVKRKTERKTEWHLVERGDVFYAVDDDIIQAAAETRHESIHLSSRICYPPLPPPQPAHPFPTASTPTGPFASGAIQIEAQNARDTAATTTTRRRHSTNMPPRMIPFIADADTDNSGGQQQFWVRELDGAYTLRGLREIMRHCQPGNWMHGPAGYPYFVRERRGVGSAF